MRKGLRFIASSAGYVRYGLGDDMYVVHEGTAVGFAFVMGLKTQHITLKDRMYVKNGAGAYRSSGIRRWFRVFPMFALRSAERFLTFCLCVAVRVYRKFLSPLQYALRITFGLQCECRFRPTCSEYALGCLRKHHLPTACFLIAKRLLRCQPLGRGGWDPVP